MWARVDEGAGALPEVALLEYLTVQAQLTAWEQVLHRKTRLQQAAMESEKWTLRTYRVTVAACSQTEEKDGWSKHSVTSPPLNVCSKLGDILKTTW